MLLLKYDSKLLKLTTFFSTSLLRNFVTSQYKIIIIEIVAYINRKAYLNKT
jgi:hypothetical protein